MGFKNLFSMYEFYGGSLSDRTKCDIILTSLSRPFDLKVLSLLLTIPSLKCSSMSCSRLKRNGKTRPSRQRSWKYYLMRRLLREIRKKALSPIVIFCMRGETRSKIKMMISFYKLLHVKIIILVQFFRMDLTSG